MSNLLKCTCGSEFFREVFTIEEASRLSEITHYHKCDSCGKLLESTPNPRLYTGIEFKVKGEEE